MSEYIEKSALLRSLKSSGVASDFALYKIRNFPAVDVSPAIHSKWEICCDGYYPYCRNCMAEPPGREMTKYCPNCGAKMDGGTTNDT